MMLESPLTERQLIARFVDALRELPEVDADLEHWKPASKHGDRGHDAQVDLHVAGKSFVLLVEAKKTVFPRDVRQVIWQFREASHGRPTGQGEEPLSLLVAESISPGAKELLRSERVGYYDSGGSLFREARHRQMRSRHQQEQVFLAVDTQGGKGGMIVNPTQREIEQCFEVLIAAELGGFKSLDQIAKLGVKQRVDRGL